MAEVHQKVGQITISPFAHWVLCTTGMSSHLKIWRAQGSQLKAIDPTMHQARTDYRFTCHAWFDDDRLVAGTADGDILVLDNQELKRTIVGALSGGSIWCIFSIGRGFVCGGDNGLVALYERTYDAAHFSLYKVVQTPEQHVSAKSASEAPTAARVVDISINPSEDSVVCCFDNNEITQFNLNQIDNLPGKSEAAAAKADSPSAGQRGASSNLQGPFRTLPIGFHQDTVTGVDVCVQKSILVSSSMDHHIRVWDFVKKRVEIDYDAKEKVYSIACHPSGLMLAVGFQRQLSIFIMLAHDLHRCYELPTVKQCREVRYSHGGQYLACVSNPPYVRISVFDAYTFLPLGYRESQSGIALTGHSASVQSICWSRNDHTLYSAGFEGAIYEWRVHKGKRNEANEWVSKYTNYACVRYDDETQMLVGLGTHKPGMGGEGNDGLTEGEMTLTTLRVKPDVHGPRPRGSRKPLGDSAIRVPPKPGAQDGRMHKQTSARACQVAISTLAHTLFVGTLDGRLLLYEWPPCGPHGKAECACRQQKELPPEPYTQLEVHQGEVLFVALSVDERFLFTVGGEDHCLFMLEVDTMSDGRAVSRKVFPYSAFEGVAFVLQQDLDDKSRLIVDLRNHNDELVRQQHADQAAVEEDHKGTIRRIEEEARREIEQGTRERDAAVQAASAESRKAQEEEEERTSAQLKASEELEALYTRRTADMEDRHRLLEAEKNDFLVRYENKLHKKQAERQAMLRNLEQQRKGRETHYGQAIDDLQLERQQAGTNMDGMIDFTIQDYIDEIDALESEHTQSLHEKTALIAAIRSETALIATKELKHTKETEVLQEVIEQKRTESRDLDEKGRTLQQSTENLKQEIAQRNDDISARERQILELKKNTAELEKLRYVLTYKFGELRKEVAPKEEKIKEMNDKIQEMDAELERIGMDRDRLRERLRGKRDSTFQLLRRLDRHNKALDDKGRGIHQLLFQLTNLVAGLDADGAVPEAEVLRLCFTGVACPPPAQEHPDDARRAACAAAVQEVRRVLGDKSVDPLSVHTLGSEPGTVLVRLPDNQASHNAFDEWRTEPPASKTGVRMSVREQNDQERLWSRLNQTVLRYASRYEEGIGAEQERDRVREFQRQREYMHQKLGAMQVMNRRVEQGLRTDNQRKTEENALLVREINELRQTKKQLHLRHQQAESQLKEVRAQLQRHTPAAVGTARGATPHRSAVCPPRHPTPSQRPGPSVDQSRPLSAPAAGAQGRGPGDLIVLRPPTPKGVLGRGTVKGRLVKGSTRSLRDLSAMDAESVGEIVKQVERTNGEILAQGGEIKRLRDFVQHLLTRAERPSLAPAQSRPARQTSSAGATRLPRVPQQRPMSAAF
eukprot:TRINITY_DN42917_c0_g1_i1.p1 TRINITY_DN42917_c0_g1~~TRINITY_DN42917_c0_g1_i1.p1  ORF type:complete len:1570 (+),score=476.77 TRINITY_DN42917_c0_g1_i1:633-4712(+)